MRKISKSNEPTELTAWKRKNRNARYTDLQNDKEGIAARQAINQQNIKDQFGLCAYCCKRINEDNSVNEHLVPRDKNHRLELDFNNIVASCNSAKQCDDAHGNQLLPLTPLMVECEAELQFLLSGIVEGKTDRANRIIEILNLNNNSLTQSRKQYIYGLLLTEGLPPEELLDIKDKELLAMLINVFQNTESNQLQPFSPVIVNILKSYLNTT